MYVQSKYSPEPCALLCLCVYTCTCNMYRFTSISIILLFIPAFQMQLCHLWKWQDICYRNLAMRDSLFSVNVYHRIPYKIILGCSVPEEDVVIILLSRSHCRMLLRFVHSVRWNWIACKVTADERGDFSMTNLLILIVLHYQSASDHRCHACLCVHCIFMVLSDFKLQCTFNNCNWYMYIHVNNSCVLLIRPA